MKFKFTNYTNNFFLRKKKILQLFMRIFILLLCSTVFSLSPSDMFSQNTKVVIEENQEATIDQVFDLLRQQTDFYFFRTIYNELGFKELISLAELKS